MSHQAMTLTLLAFIACGQTAVAFSGHRGFLSLATKMQPEVVAQTLSKVQDQWRTQVTDFLRCNATSGSAEECSDAPKAFGKSCGTVATAVVQASSGDRSVVHEYMGDVCAEPALSGWRQDQCEALAEQLTGAMTENSFDNRNSFQAEGPCSSLFSRFAAEERQRLQDEEAEVREQEHKKALEAAAEEERQAAADKSSKSANPDHAKAVTDHAQTVTEAPVTEHVIVFNAAVSANGTGSEGEAVLPQSTQGSPDHKEEATINATTDHAEATQGSPDHKEDAIVNATTDNAEAAVPQSTEGSPDHKKEAIVNATTDHAEAVVPQSTQGSPDHKEDTVVNSTTDHAEAVLPQSTQGSPDHKEDTVVNSTTDHAEAVVPQSTQGSPDHKEDTVVNSTTDHAEASTDHKEDAVVKSQTDHAEAVVPQSAQGNPDTKEEPTGNATTGHEQDAGVNATTDHAEAHLALSTNTSAGAADSRVELSAEVESNATRNETK